MIILLGYKNRQTSSIIMLIVCLWYA